MTCKKCDSARLPKKRQEITISIKGNDVKLNIPCSICLNCGEIWFSEEDADEVCDVYDKAYAEYG